MFSGCVSVSKVRNQEPSAVATFSQAMFNGQYANRNYDSLTVGSYTLWDELRRNNSFQKEKVAVPKDAVIGLVFDADSRVTARAVADGRTIDSMCLKVKRDDRYLSVKRYLFLVPIPFLFYVHQERKSLLANSATGSLIVKSGDNIYGWLLLFAVGGRKSEHSIVFARL